MEWIRKTLLFFVLSFFAYVLLWFITSFISESNVNELFEAQTKNEMIEIGCEPAAKDREFNPFNIFEFYLNLNYWTADYRMGIQEYKTEKCFVLLKKKIDLYQNPKKALKILVVDQDSNIVISIRKQVQH